MPLTRINAQLISILQTSTSRLVCSFYKMARDQLAPRTRAMLLFLRMSIPRLTSLHLYMDLLLLNGVLSLRSLLKDLLHRLLGLVAGIVLLLRSGIRAYHHSLSTLTSSARAFARQPSMLRSAQ
jgi:hypothetical protein